MYNHYHLFKIFTRITFCCCLNDSFETWKCTCVVFCKSIDHLLFLSTLTLEFVRMFWKSMIWLICTRGSQVFIRRVVKPNSGELGCHHPSSLLMDMLSSLITQQGHAAQSKPRWRCLISASIFLFFSEDVPLPTKKDRHVVRHGQGVTQMWLGNPW